ncbi:MAG: glutamate racemase [Muribaculaceae bacterium]|nr:glutamate racemase [Muribaculaceae bacterium]
MQKGSIGIFDSGYGGLTILEEIRNLLPDYDYIYLGDNARAPYGIRSFELIHKFTLEAVNYLFKQDCPLVILACNTASAKALRTIQQKDLPIIAPENRVLGVIRPTIEVLGSITKTGHIGVFGTPGTISSNAYNEEILRFYPDYKTFGQSCPMFVPLVEYGESDGEGADFFVKKYVANLLCQSSNIDTLILGCTHYPLLQKKIRQYVPDNINIISQGSIVAKSLKKYLIRHPEIEMRIEKGSNIKYLTTENAVKFNELASVFIGHKTHASKVILT